MLLLYCSLHKASSSTSTPNPTRGLHGYVMLCEPGSLNCTPLFARIGCDGILSGYLTIQMSRHTNTCNGSSNFSKVEGAHKLQVLNNPRNMRGDPLTSLPHEQFQGMIAENRAIELTYLFTSHRANWKILLICHPSGASSKPVASSPRVIWDYFGEENVATAANHARMAPRCRRTRFQVVGFLTVLTT